MSRSFLDTWVYKVMGAGTASSQVDPVDRLKAFQLQALNRTLVHARTHSRFYRNRLSNVKGLESLEGMAALPFTLPDHIQNAPKEFLGLSQDEIARIVTLKTSGTTAHPKRIFFTDQDLARTRHFFSAVLGTLVSPGDTGLIFLPGDTPASAGDLIRAAMETVHGCPRVPGLIHDFGPAADLVRQTDPALIIGMPVQILALCEYMRSQGSLPPIPYVILTADHVSEALVRRVEQLCHGKVLNHYGMTETGFGGAIQCPAQEGLHLRHPDLYIEIIDPDTGSLLPPGHWGEVAVTPLDRMGMPLIRYRTGDVSRILAAPCACGSPFPRLDRIRNRQAAVGHTTGSTGLTMADLDDLVFAIPGVVDFSARMRTDSDAAPHVPVLDIELMGVFSLSHNINIDPAASPGLTTAIESGRLRMGRVTARTFNFTNTYTGKRQIFFK